MERQVVSLGTFCLTRGMIDIAGFRAPSYPFDDIFSIPAIVEECLSNRFRSFLDSDDMLNIDDNPGFWVPKLYREKFGEHQTFVHHNMQDPKVVEKFKRRIDRFMALREDDNPLFVLVHYADRLSSWSPISSLRAALSACFGASPLLVVLLGFDEWVERLGPFDVPNALLRHRHVGEITGTMFKDHPDNVAVSGYVAEAFAATA